MAPDRQKYSEERKWGRGEEKGVTEWKSNKNESHKGVSLYVCTSLPPLYHPLSYPQGKAIHSCPLLLTHQHCKKKKKPRLFVCGGTVIWPWMLASMWQLVRKQKQARQHRKCVVGKEERLEMPSPTCGRRCGLISCLSPRQTLRILPSMLHKWNTAERSNGHIYTNSAQLSFGNEHGVTQRQKCPPRWTGADKKKLTWQRWKCKTKTEERGKTEG